MVVATVKKMAAYSEHWMVVWLAFCWAVWSEPLMVSRLVEYSVVYKAATKDVTTVVQWVVS